MSRNVLAVGWAACLWATTVAASPQGAPGEALKSDPYASKDAEAPKAEGDAPAAASDAPKAASDAPKAEGDAPKAEGDAAGADLKKVRLVIPSVIGRSSWGTIALTKALRAKMEAALGGLVSPREFAKAQLELAGKLTESGVQDIQAQLNAPEAIGKAGKAAHAHWVLFVEITRQDLSFTTRAQLVNSETGAVQMNFRWENQRKPWPDMGDLAGLITKRATDALKKLVAAGPLPEVGEGATTAQTTGGETGKPALIGEPTEAGGIAVDSLLGDLGLQAETEDELTVFLGGYMFEAARLDVQNTSKQTGEAFFDSWTRAFAFMETKIGVSTKLRLSADLDFFLPVADSGTSPLYSVQLQEAYFFHAFDAVQFKVGRQIVTWGVMDTVSPEDQMDPKDVRFSIIKAQEEGLAKVPVLSARALIPLGRSGTLDLMFVPVAVPDRFALVGTDFSVLRPGVLSAMLSGFRQRIATQVAPISRPAYTRIADGLESEIGALSPQAQIANQSLTLFEKTPNFGPEQFEGGIRATGTYGKVDFGGSLFTAHEKTPRVKVSNSLKSVFFDLPPMTDEQALTFLSTLNQQFDLQFPRYYLAGADFTARVSVLTLKAEAAVRSDSTYYDNELNPVSRPRIDGALHVEYLIGTTFALVVEGLGSHIFGDTKNLIFADQDSIRVAGHIAFAFLRESLKLRLDGVYEFSFRDFYLGPNISYQLTNRLTASAGAEIYWGPAVNLSYQQFLDPVQLSKLHFGPFALYRDNSFAFVRLMYGF